MKLFFLGDCQEEQLHFRFTAGLQNGCQIMVQMLKQKHVDRRCDVQPNSGSCQNLARILTIAPIHDMLTKT